jgi:hypothetical protein
MALTQRLRPIASDLQGAGAAARTLRAAGRTRAEPSQHNTAGLRCWYARSGEAPASSADLLSPRVFFFFFSWEGHTPFLLPSMQMPGPTLAPTGRMVRSANMHWEQAFPHHDGTERRLPGHLPALHSHFSDRSDLFAATSSRAFSVSSKGRSKQAGSVTVRDMRRSPERCGYYWQGHKLQ